MSFETQNNNTPNRYARLNPSDILKDGRETQVMLAAYEKATDILEKESLKPEMFADTYNVELMNRHAQYVAEREASFDVSRETDPGWARAEIFGKTLEAIFHDQINKGVYGDETRGVLTASYDDIHAGIDEVLERHGEDGTTHIGLALDLTFGNPKKKIDSICEDIKNNKLKEVFYYESPFGDPPLVHGKLQGIPKVIIGMDATHLIDLAEQWVAGDEEKIQSNQIFLNLLRQIQIQAEVFQDYAKQLLRPEIAERYQKVHSTISKLYTEQKALRGVNFIDSDVTQDQVNRAIQQQVSEILK